MIAQTIERTIPIRAHMAALVALQLLVLIVVCLSGLQAHAAEPSVGMVTRAENGRPGDFRRQQHSGTRR
jgi:hypothetical protein